MKASLVSRKIRHRLSVIHYHVRNKLNEPGGEPRLPFWFYPRVEDYVSDNVWERFSQPEDTRP